MKKISGKRAQHYITALEHSRLISLNECYTTFSNAKASAYNFCKDLCEDEDGWGFRIISFNSSFFSVAWYRTNENGVVQVRVETPSNSYVMDY